MQTRYILQLYYPDRFVNRYLTVRKPTRAQFAVMAAAVAQEIGQWPQTAYLLNRALDEVYAMTGADLQAAGR